MQGSGGIAFVEQRIARRKLANTRRARYFDQIVFRHVGRNMHTDRAQQESLVDGPAYRFDRLDQFVHRSSRRLDQHAVLTRDYRCGATAARDQRHLAEKLADPELDRVGRVIGVDLDVDRAA